MPPPALVAGWELEGHRFVRTRMSSLAKRWSVTRTREVCDACELAVFLWVLGREDDCWEVARSVTEAVPGPAASGELNYDIWLPVAALNALQSRIGRGRGDGSDAEPVRRMMQDSGYAGNPDFLRKLVDESWEHVREGIEDPSLVYGCSNLAVTTWTVLHLRELQVAGHECGSWVADLRLEAVIEAGRTALASRLQTAG